MSNIKINIWESDPGTGREFDGGTVITVDAPIADSTSLLTTKIEGHQPEVAMYDKGTKEFRYWNLAAAIARASAFWSPLLPDIPWQTGPILNVVMDRGELLQSDYSFEMKAIRFYHAYVLDKTIFTCESPDLIYHEMGHAVLDAFKHELWNNSIKEVKAFHEVFGDISSILCSLQLPSLREALIAETQGKIYSSSRISRFAEQFGWCTRQADPAAAETDCLRNAVNSLFYRNTDQLPQSGGVCQLTSEPHSLSRVFTGAVFEGFARMCMLHPQTNEATLLLVSQHIAYIVVHGVSTATVTDIFFMEVATKMIHVANAKFPGIAYGQALRSVFVRHGILSLADAAQFTKPLFSPDTDFNSLLKNHSGKPESIVLPVSQYGLGIDKVIVQGAERKGNSNPKKNMASATAHFESLLARGRLKIEDAQMAAKGINVLHPNKQTDELYYTHQLRKEGNEHVLVQLCI